MITFLDKGLTSKIYYSNESIHTSVGKLFMRARGFYRAFLKYSVVIWKLKFYHYLLFKIFFLLF